MPDYNIPDQTGSEPATEDATAEAPLGAQDNASCTTNEPAAPKTRPNRPFNSQNSPSPAWSVGEIAQRLGLKTVIVGGKTEHHGANPAGNGATKDGFILFDNGTAWDRKSDLKYTTAEVARLAGLEPNDFEPYRTWREANPRQTNFRPQAPRPASTPGNREATAKAPSASNANTGGQKKARMRSFPWDAAQTDLQLHR